MMTSNPDFDQNTTATEAANALGGSIKDKNVIITGTSPRSIGSATAVAVASQGPKNLILASRTASKVDAVAAVIAAEYPFVTVHKVPLDLASLESIKAAVAQIDRLVDHVDVLINNAGISHMRRHEIKTPGDTVVDLQFFTNHLGPFHFTHLLLPKLRAAANSPKAPGTSQGATRVINLSSHGHMVSPVRFYDYRIYHYFYDGVPESQKPPRNTPAPFLRTVDGYPGFIGYGQSKTANILHATELTRRLRKAGDANILALSVHPGTVDTQLSRNVDEEERAAIESVVPDGLWKTLDQAAATTIVAAFDPALGKLDVGGEDGVVGYFADCQLADGLVADHALDVWNAEMLFEESERMLGTRTGL